MTSAQTFEATMWTEMSTARRIIIGRPTAAELLVSLVDFDDLPWHPRPCT